MVDPQQYRNTLSRFATGVTVVTTLAPEGRPVGVTVSAFTSLSLDPPLVLFCLGKQTTDLDCFATGFRFALNVLAEDQMDVSEAFAARNTDKFAGIEHRPGETGCPLLAGTLATIECDRDKVHDGGDHLIIVGRIHRLEARHGRPLLRFAGAYAQLGDNL